MKNNLLIVTLIFSLAILFSSCAKKTGDACFEMSTSSTEIGQVVTFTSCSENVTTQDWDFGDGSNTSQGAVVTHLYFANGTYTVSLSVSGNNSFNVAQKNIAVGISRADTYIGTDTVLNQQGGVINFTDNINIDVEIANNVVTLTTTEARLATTNAVLTNDTFIWSKMIGSNRYDGRGVFSKVNNKNVLDLFVDEFIGSNTSKNQTFRYHGEMQ